MSTESAEQNDKEAIHSSFWCEEAEPDNPFSAAVCRCAGFDVYGDLLGKANWIEYLYLLFHGEQPGGEQTGLLNDLAVAVANPGPRDHSVQAAMAAGAGGSTLASSLMAALAVGAGNLGGAREVYAALQCWERYKQDLSQWQQALSDWKKSPQTSVWPGLEHPPGFDPNGVSCPTPVLQTLDYLAANKIAANLKWLAKNRRELEAATAMPLAFSGVAAAAFADLHCDPQQGEMLYLLLRLPGAAAHALEQHWQGWRTYPFHRDGIKLDPARGPDGQ